MNLHQWSKCNQKEPPLAPEKTPPERTEKLQLMPGPDEPQAIDDGRFDKRLPSRAAAIRELIRRRLESDDVADPTEQAASGEFRIMER